MRSTAEAIEQRALLRLRARDAQQPFGIRELRREVFGLAQLQIGGGGLLRGDVDLLRPIEFIAGRPDAQRISARIEPRRREAVAAVLIADDRDRNRRAGLLGGDQHPLHCAFLGRADLARERDRSRSLRPRGTGCRLIEDDGPTGGRDDHESLHPHGCLPLRSNRRGEIAAAFAGASELPVPCSAKRRSATASPQRRYDRMGVIGLIAAICSGSRSSHAASPARNTSSGGAVTSSRSPGRRVSGRGRRACASP
jgi:hypothetical protein